MFNYFELQLMLSKGNKFQTIKFVLLYVCRAAFNYPLQFFEVPSKFLIRLLFALLRSVCALLCSSPLRILNCLLFNKTDFK